jgi:hypothetical protein
MGANEDLKTQLAEAMRKVVLTGVGTLFLTEETIRDYLGEFKLPKELWAGLIENAAKTKNEFLTTFSKEAVQILSKIDVAKEAKSFLADHHIRFSAEISFVPKDKPGKTKRS